MNLEQLQAMSDAELNELSAVKVMGWKPAGTEKISGIPLWLGDDGKYAHYDYDGAKNWNPTTDMNDAMELASRFDYYYLFRLPNYKDGQWECKLVFDDPTDRRFYGYANTPERAITIASILAKEE